MITIQRVDATMPQKIARDNLATALNDEIAQYYQTEIARNQDQRQANLEPYLLEQANLNNQKSAIDVFNNADMLNARKSLDQAIANGYVPTTENILNNSQGFNTLQQKLVNELYGDTLKNQEKSIENAMSQASMDRYNEQIQYMKDKYGVTPVQADVDYLMKNRNDIPINTSISVASNQRSSVGGSNYAPTPSNGSNAPVIDPNEIVYDPATKQPLAKGVANFNPFASDTIDDNTQKGFSNLIDTQTKLGNIKQVSPDTAGALAVYTTLDGSTLVANTSDVSAMDKLEAMQEADKAKLADKSLPESVRASYAKQTDNKVFYISPESKQALMSTNNRDVYDVNKDGDLLLTKNISSSKGFDSVNPKGISAKDMYQNTSKITAMQYDPNIKPDINDRTLKAEVSALVKPFTEGLTTFMAMPELDKDTKATMNRVLATADGSARVNEFFNRYGANVLRNADKDIIEDIVSYFESGEGAGSKLNDAMKKLLRRDTTEDTNYMLARLEARKELASDRSQAMKLATQYRASLDPKSEEYKQITTFMEDLKGGKAKLPAYNGDILNGNPNMGDRAKQFTYIAADKDGKYQSYMGKDINGKIPVSGLEVNPLFDKLVDFYSKQRMYNRSNKNYVLPDRKKPTSRKYYPTEQDMFDALVTD
nr:MAG TPA: hypothetical protein [Caudoviricetes sp.]